MTDEERDPNQSLPPNPPSPLKSERIQDKSTPPSQDPSPEPSEAKTDPLLVSPALMGPIRSAEIPPGWALDGAGRLIARYAFEGPQDALRFVALLAGEAAARAATPRLVHEPAGVVELALPGSAAPRQEATVSLELAHGIARLPKPGLIEPEP